MAHMDRLKASRKAGGEAGASFSLSSGNEEFDRTLQSNFKSLIESGRKRMQRKETKADQDAPVAQTNVEADKELNGRDDSASEAGRTLPANVMSDHTAESSSRHFSKDLPSDHATSMTPPQNQMTKAPQAVSKPRRENPYRKKQAKSPRGNPPAKSSTGLVGGSKHRTDVPASSSTGIVGPWRCSRCTFFNEKRKWSRATCEMCSMPRSVDSAGVVHVDC